MSPDESGFSASAPIRMRRAPPCQIIDTERAWRAAYCLRGRFQYGFLHFGQTVGGSAVFRVQTCPQRRQVHSSALRAFTISDGSGGLVMPRNLPNSHTAVNG
jgi:hypothetical protein